MTHHLGGDLEELADKMGHRDQKKEAEKTKKKHGTVMWIVMSFIEIGRTERERELKGLF